jgi:hypothetical protein
MKSQSKEDNKCRQIWKMAPFYWIPRNKHKHKHNNNKRNKDEAKQTTHQHDTSSPSLASLTTKTKTKTIYTLLLNHHTAITHTRTRTRTLTICSNGRCKRRGIRAGIGSSRPEGSRALCRDCSRTRRGGAVRQMLLSCSGISREYPSCLYCIVLYCIVLYCIVLYCITV